MNPDQFKLLLSALGVLGTSLVMALRWAVNRVTKSNDDGTAALIANTASNAVLITKIDGLARQFELIGEYVRTPPQGVRIVRRGSNHDEER